MTMSEKTRSCIIIGSGIAGLLAARTLQEHGVEVTVLDKGRGVGGRMATRRAGLAVFDHGAQFFTARDPRFSALVSKMLEADAAKEWCRGFADPEGKATGDGHPRYRGASGMTSIPKYLAQGLNIRLHSPVEAAALQTSAGDGLFWSVHTHQRETFVADLLILTAPVPQSLSILDAGGVVLPSEARFALEAVRYDPCITLMVQPPRSHVPFPGGMQFAGEPIAFLGDNQQKGISSDPALTLHAAPEFSKAHWTASDEEVIAALLKAASAWIPEPGPNVVVHRWRFAKPSVLHPNSCLAVTTPLPLVFAGDAFGTPRVEGAALSGLAAAQSVLEILSVDRNSTLP